MFATNPENCECGLMWVCPTLRERRPVCLKSVNITASVVHAVAQVEITQIYVNSENDPIEASYIFPVDSNGAVTHFHAELDGRIIKAAVKSHTEAEKDYETAIKNRQTVFLGEEVKPDVLQVGFLKPGAQAKVVIGYVTEVKNDPDSHAVRFVIPTTVAPRYVPPSTSDDPRSSKLARMTFSESSPAPLSIKVVVSIHGEIKSVESLSAHDILIETKGVIPEQPGNWNKVVVTLAGNMTDMNRDFVLAVTPAEAVMHPRIYYEVLASGSLAAMVHLIPSFALKEEKVDLVILLDRSGSMEGQSIRMASAALQLFVHSLPPDCYFNIVGFGSSHEFLFKEGSQKYDQASLIEAEKCAKDIRANLGGTEILPPLEEIYSRPHIPGYLRQIFIITDGQVSNTDQVIGLAKRNAHQSRLFALGIGSSSCRHLVQGMASAGGGTAAFVERDEGVHKATLSQLKNALQPSLTDVKIEWLGIPAPPPVKLNTDKTLFGYNKPLSPEEEAGVKNEMFSQAPENIPPIFDGNQMIVFGVFPASMDKPTGVKITANSPDGPLTLQIQTNEENHLVKTEMLHKLAVIKLIRGLELAEAAHPTYHSSSIKRQIEELGVQHGIASKYTSFIACDDSNDHVSGEIQFLQIPSQLPGGYSPTSPGYSPTSPCYGLPNFTTCDSVDLLDEEEEWEDGAENLVEEQGKNSEMWEFSQKEQKLEEYLRQKYKENVGDCKLSSGTPDASNPPDQQIQPDHANDTLTTGSLPSPEPVSKEERVMEIINQQKFDGSFGNDFETLCRVLGISLEEATAEAIKHGWKDVKLDLWATTLALACLTTDDFKEEKELWDLAVRKGHKWLALNCSDENAKHDMMMHATYFLQRRQPTQIPN